MTQGGAEKTLSGLLLALAVAVPAGAQPPCDSLPAPWGAIIEVRPDQASSLRGIVDAAEAGTTILLHPGTYEMSLGDATSRLVFDTPGVTLRSFSGDRASVVLDGAYQTNELVSIYASNVTIANLTLKRAFDHPIHINGTSGNPISGVVLHNLRIVDPGQQAVKINAVADGYADDGVIECSHIELTQVGRTQIRDNCYTGGIDAHAARGWRVQRNRIEGFWCPSGLSEHGVHFWRASRDTLVEQNVIVDCARGVGFGLGTQGGSRVYPDDPYPNVSDKGHIDGMIRNNFIAAADASLQASSSGFDVGIGLEQAHGVRVLHNTVASSQQPSSSSIEWRFSGTNAQVGNNLVSHNLKERDGAQASLSGNVLDAPLGWFESVVQGDLHLVDGASGAVDVASDLAPGLVDFDIDDEIRGSLRDAGADEYGLLFADGFETAGPYAWSSVLP
jgi:hypothetical protein